MRVAVPAFASRLFAKGRLSYSLFFDLGWWAFYEYLCGDNCKCMRGFSFRDIWARLKSLTWSWLYRLDERQRWLKFVLVAVAIFLMAFVFGNNDLKDYWSLEERRQLIQGEIDELEPKLAADSTRLEDIKNQGREIEAVARERYLMKSPGEQIFIIKQDSSHNTKK